MTHADTKPNFLGFTPANRTIRRIGWYFTENYPPCGIYRWGHIMTIQQIKVEIELSKQTRTRVQRIIKDMDFWSGN